LRFTEFLQSEYSEEDILTFAIHPGSVPTDISAKLPQYFAPMLKDSAELPGDTTVWLTKERREWLKGRYVDCCWDVTELEAKKQEIVEGDKLKVSLVV
jgi:NAD(P)-dependent dehydrogenase (short-subunit alcohol dehydrogenase family)